MTKRKKKMIMFAGVFVCLAMLLAVAGCAPEEAANGEDGTIEVKIGTVGPLTGGAANYGINILHAVEIAVEEANASGELGNISLKLISEDTGEIGLLRPMPSRS